MNANHWTTAGPFHKIAHRGASAHAEPNSLEAFGLARQLGATDIEADLHCTSDGRFVIRHDAVLSGRPGQFISQLSYDQYRRLCRDQGRDSLELEPTIDLAKQSGLGLYLDVKQVLPGKLDGLLDLIDNSRHRAGIVIASFRTDIVKAAKDRDPACLTAVMFHDPNLDANSLIAGVGCDFLHPCFDIFANPLKHFTPEKVAGFRAAGAGLIAWNITTAEMAEAVVGLDVQGACADDPHILDAALANR